MTNTGLSSVSEPPRVLPWRKMLADWRAHLIEVQRRKDAGEPPLKSIEEYRAEEHASAVSCGANDSEEEGAYAAPHDSTQACRRAHGARDLHATSSKPSDAVVAAKAEQNAPATFERASTPVAAPPLSAPLAVAYVHDQRQREPLSLFLQRLRALPTPKSNTINSSRLPLRSSCRCSRASLETPPAYM